MKKFKNHILAALLLVLISSIALVNITLAQADDFQFPQIDALECILWNTATWIAYIAIFVAIVVVVIAGVLWAVSAGDDEKVTTARKWVVNGLVGLVLALAAYTVVTFVLDRVFGSSLGFDTSSC
jgi:hypothetical protein